MPSTAVSFPGKFGDLIWSLPAVRAISETYGEPVTLVVSRRLAPIVPLLKLQPYIQDAYALEQWETQDTAPVSPRVPPGDFDFDKVFHLGLEGWPQKPLPQEIVGIAYRQYQGDGLSLFKGIDLDTPWITLPIPPKAPHGLVIGFTDEWFELKYGLVELLNQQVHHISLIFSKDSRWDNEGGWGGACDWIQAANKIRDAKQFLGCCSALHVLACALGKNVTLMEPNSARHNDIFYPCGKTGRVHLVCGNDGLPTHDARHVREALVSTREQRA